MIAGKMRSYLDLMKPNMKTDNYGDDSITYQVTKTVHAERVKISGRRSDEVGEHFPDYDAEFNIRAEHAIDENWRVRQRGGHLYDVTNIIPNIDKGFKTLICQRVNE
mgnify:CR=1 FL=1